MKKRIFILGSLLLAMLVFNLPGFAAVDTSTTDEGKPQDSISQEMKSIPLEVPAFIDKIRLTGRVQALWKVWGEHDDQAVGLGDILENEGFRIPRWRFGVAANLFEHVRIDVTMGESEFRREHDVNLLDALITLTYLDYANVSVGAGKLPVGRQHMTSSKNMAFIFRPVLSRQMFISKVDPDLKDTDPDKVNGLGIPDRDVGITVFGSLWEGMVKYYAGIYNGTGDYFRGSLNYEDDEDFLRIMGDYAYALRAVVNPLGDFPDTESDFSGEVKVSIGASLSFNDIAVGQNWHNRYTVYGVDGVIRGYGLSITGEWIKSVQENKFYSTLMEKTDRDGFFVQAGYFVYPDYIEAVYRYEQFDDNSHLQDNGDIKYHTIGLNYYVKQNNNFKVQVNYIIRGEDGPEIFNDGLYALAQVAF